MRWAFYALGALVVLILLGKFVALTKALFTPISGKEVVSNTVAGAKNYQWDGNSTINLVVKSQNIYTLSYNPVDGEITILKIPDDTYLNVPNGFGRWPTRSIYALGQSDSRTSGSKLLKQTMQLTLGVPIDGYISLAGPDANRPLDEVIGSLRKSPIGTLSFIRQSSSDLSPFELTRLLWQWWGVRADKIKSIDLGQSQITQSILLPDGSRALGIEQIHLDQLIQSQFQDTSLNYEGLNIAIYNATDHPGLADNASRMITNMGGRVIYTANSPEPLDKTIVSGKNSYTRTRLAEVFAPRCIKANKDCVITDSSIDLSRVDVSIFLGEDAYAKFGDH